MHEHGIADIAGELGNRNAVSHQMILVVFAIVLHLGGFTLAGKSFKSVLNTGIFGNITVSEKQMATGMAVRTECPLDFCSTLGRKHGAAVFCLHKGPELCGGKCCFDFKLLLPPVGGHTAVEVFRMVSKADSEFSVTSFPGVFSLELKDRQNKRMVFMLIFFRHNLKPPQE